ncbi:di-heme enzyme (plasmid) [Diaphorobacter sp. HDW4B]|uniref:methanobactin export MATE transporter MbnM n=1 Tax=Diaphorobacter sp. HDW4B TaxID=2714925 RepID=UPI00140D7001|nr:methanobactin export MATE transporter MbnM [Diaphorobacter sp. HDW4B]QIL74305.1 di-heme enzyme [Diaphorobacter sp. HDW4B]
MAALLVALGVQACGGGGSSAATTTPDSTTPEAAVWQWKLPPGFTAPAVPADNPMSTAKVELGRALFHDVRLSGNATQSCASCHTQESAFTDNRSLSRGSTGEVHPRNAQPLANVAWNTTFTWAHPDERTLEHQMLKPIFGTNPVELGVNDSNRAEVLSRFQADTRYASRFKAAFSGESDPVSWDNIIKAIAAFERTLISADSRYDQSVAGKITLSAQEARGMKLFFSDQAKCAQCHGSPNFNDQFSTATSVQSDPSFHNTGLFNIGGTGAYPEPNRGVYEVTKQAQDMGKFRAASLRNIELTAPYMHDGSIGTLEAVLDFYAAGGRNVGNGLYAGDGRLNPYKDERISKIMLSGDEKADLVAFLKTLTDTGFVSNAAYAAPGTN